MQTIQNVLQLSLGATLLDHGASTIFQSHQAQSQIYALHFCTGYQQCITMTRLWKYSKMRTSKFCGYRHEALGPPPPFVSNFAEKKLTSIFFLEIESKIAKTNFTLGPIEKSIFLVQL